MTRVERRFVVVSGLPGSGKSTLARALAPLLALPILDKDDILDRLFDARGTGDAHWRRRLSRESDAALQAEAAASNGAVLVSFWHADGMPADSGTPAEWVAALSPSRVHVHCVCPIDVAASRFGRRQRHPGHLDEHRTPGEIRASLEAIAGLPLPALGRRVLVETSGDVNVKTVLGDVEAAFAWQDAGI